MCNKQKSHANPWNLKKIISKEISILFSGDVKIQHINSAIYFFSILPVRISEKHEDLLNALDVIEECQFLSRTNKKRNQNASPSRNSI